MHKVASGRRGRNPVAVSRLSTQDRPDGPIGSRPSISGPGSAAIGARWVGAADSVSPAIAAATLRTCSHPVMVKKVAAPP
jgi:hypothetical protein